MNQTDEDAHLMEGRQGIMPGYNAQAMVSLLDPARARRSELLITASDITITPTNGGTEQRMVTVMLTKRTTEPRCPNFRHWASFGINIYRCCSENTDSGGL